MSFGSPDWLFSTRQTKHPPKPNKERRMIGSVMMCLSVVALLAGIVILFRTSRA